MRVETTVQLRLMRQDDIAAGLRLCRASGWNQVAHDWELFLALSPQGCRVAVDHTGQVVGSVATLRYGNAFGWVAMVLVDPAHRGGGIGTRLLQEAVTLLDDMPAIRLDATPAGVPVYVRAGFVEEWSLQRMQRPGGLADVRSSQSGTREGKLRGDMQVRPMMAADMEAVTAWDNEAFGADRRVLLDDLRSHAPGDAWVADNGELQGYLFGRRGHDFEHLGPLVARSEPVAQKLVAECLSVNPARRYILDAAQHQSWIAWLESLGFTTQRPFTRMCRGQQRYRSRPDQTFAILGPEFG
jgi:predicted N-acetyltransferase YhbS